MGQLDIYDAVTRATELEKVINAISNHLTYNIVQKNTTI